ncbi:hypothetical protein HDU83_009364 [Entophlyctis luteolus]|nr:hypothetical protein HDU83_009364 [Entophlyctis luteolus]
MSHSQFHSTKVVHTGGNGFIASHIIYQLLTSETHEYHVTATVRSPEKAAALMDLPNAAERLTITEAHLTDPKWLDFAGQMVEHADDVEGGRYLVVNDHTTSFNEVSAWMVNKYSGFAKAPKMWAPPSLM